MSLNVLSSSLEEVISEKGRNKIKTFGSLQDVEGRGVCNLIQEK